MSTHKRKKERKTTNQLLIYEQKCVLCKEKKNMAAQLCFVHLHSRTVKTLQSWFSLGNKRDSNGKTACSNIESAFKPGTGCSSLNANVYHIYLRLLWQELRVKPRETAANCNC